jgi:hypothetical protein
MLPGDPMRVYSIDSDRRSAIGDQRDPAAGGHEPEAAKVDPTTVKAPEGSPFTGE